MGNRAKDPRRLSGIAGRAIGGGGLRQQPQPAPMPPKQPQQPQAGRQLGSAIGAVTGRQPAQQPPKQPQPAPMPPKQPQPARPPQQAQQGNPFQSTQQMVGQPPQQPTQEEELAFRDNLTRVQQPYRPLPAILPPQGEGMSRGKRPYQRPMPAERPDMRELLIRGRGGLLGSVNQEPKLQDNTRFNSLRELLSRYRR
jgi:outer membrane biosynthesis protein TonB